MLLTISTTHEPATDLGYLLHKHPGRVRSFTESVGTAHVFYQVIDLGVMVPPARSWTPRSPRPPARSGCPD